MLLHLEDGAPMRPIGIRRLLVLTTNIVPTLIMQVGCLNALRSDDGA